MAHPRPYILALGRLTYKKGFDLLMEAFAQTAGAVPTMDLVLAGDGEELPAPEARDGGGLEGRLHFFGVANLIEVVQLLNGCEFVVIPSVC